MPGRYILGLLFRLAAWDVANSVAVAGVLSGLRVGRIVGTLSGPLLVAVDLIFCVGAGVAWALLVVTLVGVDVTTVGATATAIGVAVGVDVVEYSAVESDVAASLSSPLTVTYMDSNVVPTNPSSPML